MLSRKAKEAIKTGLAFALVYGIALQSGWLNPYWAGFAVAMISLQTAGESIHKGLNRMVGTIPGGIAAIVILALAAQSRWELILLTSLWIFFTAYMSMRSRNSPYLWTVAGFVALVLVTSGASTSEDLFEHVVFRVVETAMGIAVYTLVSVFLWPLTNAGAIKTASKALLATQSAICRAGREVMTGMVDATATRENRDDLHRQELEQLTQLAQALVAEGSESYEVQEVRPQWNRFLDLSKALRESLERWHTSMTELARTDVNAALTGVAEFFDELDCRFEEIQKLLKGRPAQFKPGPVFLGINRTAFGGLSHFEQAALAVTRTELEKLEFLTAALFDCTLDLEGQAMDNSTPQPLPVSGAVKPGIKLPVFDLDRLRSAAYAAVVTCAGFCVWIYVDPPGHSGWLFLSGTLALNVILMLQVPVIRFVKPLAVAAVLCICVYVFIMPRLSTYYELGLLLFVCMFTVRYFFTGLAQLMGNLAIINLISIQNQQTYDFAVLVNTMIFLVTVFLFLHVLSYIMGSPRPEKKVLTLLRRFFRSTEFLMSSVALEPGGKASALAQWKIAFYLHEMKSLPGKIGVWSKAIDQNKFSSNKPDQMQSLVTTLQGLMYRIEYLLEARETRQAESLAREMTQSVHAWRESIESIFVKWSGNPGSEPAVDLEQRLAAVLSVLEQRIDAIIAQPDRETISVEDGENFYRLLGAYRGVSEAAVAYAGNAAAIDWSDWSEEKF
jgi:uncharacterized membrane protein YccC